MPDQRERFVRTAMLEGDQTRQVEGIRMMRVRRQDPGEDERSASSRSPAAWWVMPCASQPATSAAIEDDAVA